MNGGDPSPSRPNVTPALVAAGVWLLATLAAIPLYAVAESAPGRPLALGRCVFQAVNTASLTGFTTSWSNLSTAEAGSRWVTLGLVTVATLACLIIGLTALATLEGRSARWLTRMASLIFAAYLLIFVAPAAITLTNGRAADEVPAFFAGLLAFANGGQLAVSPEAPQFWIALAPLAAFGALLPALLCGIGSSGPRLSGNLMANVAGMAVALGLSLLLLWPTAGPTTSMAALATDARSSALTNGVEDVPRTGRWALVPLMLLGTAGGGTGGGLKVTTAAVLLLGGIRLLRGGPAGRTFGIAFAWLLTLVVLFGATFLALLAVLPQLSAERVALLAAGACGNVGLTVDPVVASGVEAWILSTAMLLGRVLPWGMLWWSATRGDETIAVG